MKYIWIIIGSLSLTSCFTERIDLDLNEGDQKKLVVEAWITDFDEPQFVNLSFTSNYFDSLEIEYATGAIVSLADDLSTFDLMEISAGKYQLPLDWIPVDNQRYDLRIDHDDQVYTSSYVYRTAPDLQDIFSRIDDDADLEEDSPNLYELVFSFQDRIGEVDGFYIAEGLQGASLQDSLEFAVIDTDEYIDGDFFKDLSFTDSEKRYKIGDVAVLEFHTVGADVIDFFTDVLAETAFRGGPFDAPPANVRTNITGGAVGYFVMSSGRRYELLIEE